MCDGFSDRTSSEPAVATRWPLGRARATADEKSAHPKLGHGAYARRDRAGRGNGGPANAERLSQPPNALARDPRLTDCRRR